MIAQARSAGLEKAAATRGLTVVSTDFISRTDALPGIGSSPQFTGAVFNQAEKAPPDLVQIATGYAVFEVLAIKPPATPTFDEIHSRSVAFGADKGPRIRVSYPDATFMGVWTKPGADFICIEPWHGVADPAGFSGDFSAKPGVFMVAPGAALPIKMAITLLET